MGVAVIGSSGGGTATLGHTDPEQLLRTIHSELLKIHHQETSGRQGILYAFFIVLHDGIGMDLADHDTDLATLYAVLPNEEDNTGMGGDKRKGNKEHQFHVDNNIYVQTICSDVLRKVNEKCKSMDSLLSNAILKQEISGLICISCDVRDNGIHHDTLLAASRCKLPITGSGGTSLSKLSSIYQVNLIGNTGGSVATTSYTRAMSFTNALCTAWGKEYEYHPFTSSADIHRPQWRSVLNSCLPVFWIVCLSRHALISIIEMMKVKEEGLSSDIEVDKTSSNAMTMPLMIQIELCDSLTKLLYVLENHLLPTACCIIMAVSSCGSSSNNSNVDTSTIIMSSTIVSMVCYQSILGGLLGGYIVSILLKRCLFMCICLKIPNTMSNLVVAGGIGMIISMCLLPIIPVLRHITSIIRYVIKVSMAGTLFPGLGFIIGIMFCYLSKIGGYHSLCLPIILIEIENKGSPSIWGAIDELTLVLVSAGICAANILLLPPSPPTSKEVSSPSSPKNSNNRNDLINNTIDKDSLINHCQRDEDYRLCLRGLLINLTCGDFIEAAYPYMERHWFINLIGYLASGLSTELLIPKSFQRCTNFFMEWNANNDSLDDDLQVEDGPVASLAYVPFIISIWLAGKTGWKQMSAACCVAFGVTFVGTILNNCVLHALHALESSTGIEKRKEKQTRTDATREKTKQT